MFAAATNVDRCVAAIVEAAPKVSDVRETIAWTTPASRTVTADNVAPIAAMVLAETALPVNIAMATVSAAAPRIVPENNAVRTVAVVHVVNVIQARPVKNSAA